METLAKAFPEKTFLRTTKGLMLCGSAIAPGTNPAFKRTATLGAMD
jgi:hypothetical protein